MTKEDWKSIYDELNDLMEEFHEKWRKNNFTYKIDYDRNNERVIQIIRNVVIIIRQNKELEDFIFERKPLEYRNMMEATGFWDDTRFNIYMSKMMKDVESKI